MLNIYKICFLRSVNKWFNETREWPLQEDNIQNIVVACALIEKWEIVLIHVHPIGQCKSYRKCLSFDKDKVNV